MLYLTYLKEQTLMTPYPANVILDVPERTNANDAVSRQRYNMTYRKEQTLMTPYPTMLYLTYQKEQTLMTPYPANVILDRKSVV